MSHWEIKKLSEVADIISGGTPSSKENAYYDNGNIPWITPKDLSNYKEMYISKGERNITELGLKNSSARLLPKGSILFSSRAPIGYIAIAKNELCTNQGFKNLVFKDGHIPEFYYYLLKNNVSLFESRASGSTFKEVSGQVVKDTKLNIPDLRTQQNIVSILKPFDEKITINTQTNQTLEQIAQAIFKHWFIDFAPVHAKANAIEKGATPEQVELAAMVSISGKTEEKITALKTENLEAYYQLQQTVQAFPSEFVESEMGLIPKGWEVKKVGDTITRLRHKQKLQKNDISTTGSIPVFEQGQNILMGYHCGDPEFIATTKDPIFIFGDHTCITHISTQPFSIYQNVIPVKGNKIPTLWVYLAIKDKQQFQEYRRHWMEFIIKNICIPSEKIIIQYFLNIVEPLFEKRDKLSNQNKTLIEVRDALLPKLLSGEIELNSVF